MFWIAESLLICAGEGAWLHSLLGFLHRVSACAKQLGVFEALNSLGGLYCLCVECSV